MELAIVELVCKRVPYGDTFHLRFASLLQL